MIAQIFGSDKFDRYVGELQMQSEMMGHMDEDDMDPGKLPFFNSNDQKQQKRVAKCALELAEKLQPLVPVGKFVNELGESGGDKPAMTLEEFKTAQTEEIEELVGTPFGAMLLYEIGKVYMAKAKIWIGKHATTWASVEYFSGEVEATKMAARSLGKKLEAAGAAFDAFRAGRAAEMQIRKLDESEAKNEVVEGSTSAPTGMDDNGSEEAASTVRDAPDVDAGRRRQEAEEAAAAKAATPMMNVMWKMTAIDVESTLKTVCDLLFKDESIDVPSMRKRAEGLLALGELFCAAADRDGGEAGRKARYLAGLKDMASGGGPFGAGSAPGDDNTGEQPQTEEQRAALRSAASCPLLNHVTPRRELYLQITRDMCCTM
eukprot:SAG31_NODE_4711_length_3016_cov_5.967089_2_plen_374_part_00